MNCTALHYVLCAAESHTKLGFSAFLQIWKEQPCDCTVPDPLLINNPIPSFFCN